jgi:dienelactone hydrolase
VGDVGPGLRPGGLTQDNEVGGRFQEGSAAGSRCREAVDRGQSGDRTGDTMTLRPPRDDRTVLLRAAAAVCAVTLLVGCTAGDPGAAPSASLRPEATSAEPSTPGNPSGGSSAPAPDETEPTPEPDSPKPTVAAAGPPPTSGPVRLERWFDREFSGGGVRLGPERERTRAYRSYTISFRSQDLRISGVVDVPTGSGPFPAVVLAHGYIDPAVYVRGQGMPRERRQLAAAGYIALHVDYRNHAASDDDPANNRNARLGYSVDVINAVNALRATQQLPVDDDRIALMGRSMGGGVVYKALEMSPGLVDAAIVYAAVSSNEAENYEQFGGPSPYWDYVEQRWGTPRENPEHWKAISADQHFARITEPVLMQHGTVDESCPPRWARHTLRAMERAGVDVTLRWYEGEGHTFGAAFDRSMDRTLAFLRQHLS